MVTFGNLEFSKLTINSIRDTTKHPVDFFVVVGKPYDRDTVRWLESENIPHKIHDENFGFPCSVNDLYDYAWKDNDYDNLIIVGNDIVAYPNSVDSLIDLADTSDYSVISAIQIDVRSLVSMYPATKQYFQGSDMIFTDFTADPWNEFKEYNDDLTIADMKLYDIQNMCLYKKSMFDAIGYTDVNFYPAYFVDNDYARRIVNSGIRSCTVISAKFFHFWSRTIKQASGGSTAYYFDMNKKYYKKKWGGHFGSETKVAPTKIDSRDNEITDINKWRK